MDTGHQLVFHLLNGLVWGLVIALVSSGLSLSFGLAGIINLAHGEFFMLGAVLCYLFLQVITSSFCLAALLAACCVAILGLTLEYLVIRPVKHDPPAAMVVTFGIALAIQHAVLYTFGATARRIDYPLMATFDVFGVHYPLYRLAVAVVSLLLLGLLLLGLRHTRFGLWVRTVAHNREMALLSGVPVDRVFTLTFGLSSALAALAGALVAPFLSVDFRMGVEVLPLAFMAVIVGGLRSVAGTACGALAVGVGEGALLPWMDPAVARLWLLAGVALLLLWKPTGLLTSGVRRA